MVAKLYDHFSIRFQVINNLFWFVICIFKGNVLGDFLSFFETFCTFWMICIFGGNFVWLTQTAQTPIAGKKKLKKRCCKILPARNSAHRIPIVDEFNHFPTSQAEQFSAQCSFDMFDRFLTTKTCMNTSVQSSFGLNQLHKKNKSCATSGIVA